jgi:glycosyltransferase involved in cell wall biosynthesis
MRILHVIGGLEIASGGPNIVAPEMASSVAKRGHDVQIFTSASASDAEARPEWEYEGASIRAFPRSAPARFAVSYPMARALLAEVSEFDVIHVHSMYLFHSTVAPALARRAGVPYVVRPHGTLHPLQRRVSPVRKAIFHRLLQDRNLNRAGAMHYTSANERNYSEKAGVTAPGWVIPLAVQPPAGMAGSNAFLDRFPQLRDRSLVVFLGRLASKKRPELVVEAFRRVLPLRPNSHLVIAGPDDGQLAPLKRAVAAARLESTVTFPGLVGGETKGGLLSAASVLVLPSDWENFGVSVAEAMAYGVPVVITPGVDISGEVREAAAGVVVDQDSESIADGIQQLLADPERAHMMGQRGRTLVEERFNWNTVALQLETMYRSLSLRGMAPT